MQHAVRHQRSVSGEVDLRSSDEEELVKRVEWSGRAATLRTPFCGWLAFSLSFLGRGLLPVHHTTAFGKINGTNLPCCEAVAMTQLEHFIKTC